MKRMSIYLSSSASQIPVTANNRTHKSDSADGSARDSATKIQER